MQHHVLITGAAGFIGSHLVDRYLADGWRVTGVDNFITGSSENLENARGSANFAFVEADIVSEWPDIDKADLILHFASPASPIDYAELPLQTMLVNSAGTQRCLEAAQKWSSRILYASTSECYGDPLVHPQREDYWGNVNPNGPRSCYDEAKRFGEALVMVFARSYGVDARIIRIFNTYGPRMRKNDGRVVPNFVTQALNNEPLTIYGGGQQTRSFCYVDDLVDGIVGCAASEETRDIVVNLGNPSEHTIRQFAEIVAEIAGVQLTTEDRPMPVDDPGRRCPDISRAQKLLQWAPQVGVREGLRRTLDYFKTLP